MYTRYNWSSCNGSNTLDNRDFCGVNIQHNNSVFIVADGATNCPNGGSLAQELIQKILQLCTNDCTDSCENCLPKHLHQIHNDIRLKYVQDFTAYLIAIFKPNKQLIIIYAGDCLIGKVNKSKINWLNTPHTLANATTTSSPKKLPTSELRNTLTKCFKGRRFVKPENHIFKYSLSDTYVIATDGFWAEIPDTKQIELINNGQNVNNPLDDTSFLVIGNKNDSSILEE